MKQGQVFTLSSPDIPAETRIAKVIELSPVVDPSSGTIEVLVEIVGPRGQLRPGMTVALHVASLP